MAGGDSFNMAEEFSGVDFNEGRFEKRFRKAMETLAKDPQKSIYGSCATRAESKAIYNLLGNEKFDKDEVIKAHRTATIRRMEGNGYINDKTMGVNIHSCLAVTPEGLVLGMLDQADLRSKGFNRREPKNTSLTREQQKNRSIEEKESNRWLTTMENADGGMPANIKVFHVCDREGDMYELFDKAIQSGRYFLVRIVQNRMTVENGQILDKIKQTRCKGRIKVRIPRDSRQNVKELEGCQIHDEDFRAIPKRENYNVLREY